MNAQTVLQARADGDLRRALSLALESWRHNPTLLIADAIETLDLEARADFDAPKARTKAEAHATWMSTAAQSEDVLATGWLARSLTRKLPIAADYFGILRASYVREKYAALLERFEGLRQRGPDPRIADEMMQVLRRAPFPIFDERSATVLYGALCDLIVAQRDRRVLPALHTLHEHPLAPQTTIRDFLEDRLPEMISALEAVENRAPADAADWLELAPDDDDEVDEALEAELLEAIRSDPDDDDARHIYADLLQQRGDPHGEYIAICLVPENERSAAAGKRARSLLRKHKNAWLGEGLSRVLKHVVFERGFLHSAGLAQNAAASEELWKAAAGDPRLGTLRELFKSSGNTEHYTDFLRSEHTRHVDSLEVLNWKFCELLMKEGLLARCRYPHFHFRPSAARWKTFAGVCEPTGISVRLREPDELEPCVDDIEQAGLLGRLKHFSIMSSYGGPSRPQILALWSRLPQTLDSLGYDIGLDPVLTLYRSDEGTVLRATGDVGYLLRGAADALPADLRRLELRCSKAVRERAEADLLPIREAFPDLEVLG